ncbi:MAG TPA: class I SAM-dependent methyltransferase [Desulfobacteraceae bacterium]|nr:class I SAM-dependent methyltransferase [Desulfobacteraceae bacterium]HPJ66370.1 class I SAM-dependent methyltransferase [Desulfobacteraceae bacterium]HPQ27213.1 class I SAM-dependent methyltransferase [Desulfobacteraceae bacterium]
MTDDFNHQTNITRQANEHPLVVDSVFKTIEEYVLHLMHLKSYETASEICMGKDVLDWGCNVGYGMEILAKNAASVSGLDLSERAVIAARKRLGDKATQIHCYDGIRCAFANQSFDVVTSFQVLEHISDYDTYFNEIRRVLKPGGLAVFATPNALLRLEPGMKPWNEFHIHEFAPSELREFLMTRFPSVTIRGLFAIDQFYWIERNRVERAKQGVIAAQKARSISIMIKTFVKKHYPFTLRIRDAMTRKNHTRPKTLSSSEIKQFTIADLFYRDENLDNALDLMAVCKKSY